MLDCQECGINTVSSAGAEYCSPCDLGAVSVATGSPKNLCCKIIILKFSTVCVLQVPLFLIDCWKRQDVWTHIYPAVSCDGGKHRNATMTTCQQCSVNTVSSSGAENCIYCGVGAVGVKGNTACGKTTSRHDIELLYLNIYIRNN